MLLWLPVCRGRDAVLVDADTYEWAKESNWWMNGGYACRQTPRVEGRRSTIYLHREILGLAKGDPLWADHINGNTRDNRRSNLRAITRQQNSQNVRSRGRTSSYRGVYWCKSWRCWRATAMVDGKGFSLGNFSTEEEAAAAASAFRATHMPFSTDALERAA